MKKPYINKEILQGLVTEKCARKLNLFLAGQIVYRCSDGRVLDCEDFTESVPKRKIKIVRD